MTDQSERPVVVLGAGGQLGQELCQQLASRALPFHRATLDITDHSKVLSQLRDSSASAVINAAAYTQVDRAEQEVDCCFAVNAEAISHLVEACKLLHCPFVQISTDFVYGSDLARNEPYQETAAPGPLSVYGRSKLEGERRASAYPVHFIVRTCGLYGVFGGEEEAPSFAKTMLQLSRKHTSLRVVADQRCTPSYAPHVAQAVLKLLETTAYGTYHVTNAGSTTWHEFATTIFRHQRLQIETVPITSADWGAAASRPTYSVLDCTKYASLVGAPLPSWENALSEYLSRRKSFYEGAMTMSSKHGDSASDIAD